MTPGKGFADRSPRTSVTQNATVKLHGVSEKLPHVRSPRERERPKTTSAVDPRGSLEGRFASAFATYSASFTHSSSSAVSFAAEGSPMAFHINDLTLDSSPSQVMQHRQSVQYRQYQQWRERRKSHNDVPQLNVSVGCNNVPRPAAEDSGVVVEQSSRCLMPQFSFGGDEDNPRPVAFDDNAEVDLPTDNSNHIFRESGGPWDWWQRKVLPWVSDEARREVRHMEDFLVRCVMADHTEGCTPDEAHNLVTRVLRHATHEVFRRIPVMRLGTVRALEAAQKRAASLQLDLVNVMSVLEHLRLGQRRRTAVCFALWRAQILRRQGMDAISAKLVKRANAGGLGKCYVLWRDEVIRRRRQMKLAKKIVEKMLGKGLLTTYWLTWKQVVSDNIRDEKEMLADDNESLQERLKETNRQLRTAEEDVKHEHDRAEREKERGDEQFAEASRLRRELDKANARIKALEDELERMRRAANDASAASIQASARSMLGRCSLASQRLRMMASMHTPDPRVLLTRDELLNHGDGIKALQEMHGADIIVRFVNRCRELSHATLERTGQGSVFTAASYQTTLEFLQTAVVDMQSVNQKHLSAVLECIGLVRQGLGMTRKADKVSQSTLRQMLQDRRKGAGRSIELPEDMWAAAEAAQELLDAVESKTGWPVGYLGAEELVGNEPAAMGVLLCYLFMHFPGEKTLRAKWQEEAAAGCERAEELEKALASTARDPASALATGADTLKSWSLEVEVLEAMATTAVREQGLARRAFVSAVRIVDALAVTLQEARHGGRTAIMVALGSSEYSLFTELRFSKIRDLFGSETECAKAMEMIGQVLRDNFNLLQDVYKHYAPSGQMDSLHFWSLVRDCNLESGPLSAAQIDIIFTRADLDDDMSRNNILEPQDYVEALVRIACALAVAAKSSSVGAVPSPSPETAAEACASLLQDTLAFKAGKSNAAAFRQMLDKPEIRNVFRDNRDNLRLIFAKYAAADMSNQARATMNFKEFEMLLKDGNLLIGGLTQQVVTKIFANVQNDGDVTELDYAEFLEAIAACSCFRDANPYAKFEDKLAKFIEGRLLPSLAPK